MNGCFVILRCVCDSVENLCAAAAAPAPEDLIQSATYPEEQAGPQGQGLSNRVSPDYAQSYGRSHEGMDIDSAAVHRIPRGASKLPT